VALALGLDLEVDLIGAAEADRVLAVCDLGGAGAQLSEDLDDLADGLVEAQALLQLDFLLLAHGVSRSCRRGPATSLARVRRGRRAVGQDGRRL